MLILSNSTSRIYPIARETNLGASARGSTFLLSSDKIRASETFPRFLDKKCRVRADFSNCPRTRHSRKGYDLICSLSPFLLAEGAKKFLKEELSVVGEDAAVGLEAVVESIV